MHLRVFVLRGLAAVAAGCLLTVAHAGQRVAFGGSVRMVPAEASAAAKGTRHAHVVRAQLRDAEKAADVGFEIALRIRNFAELQQRIAAGETISRAEMADRYFPTAEDYSAVTAWVTGQGLRISRSDPSHLAVFVHGSAAQVAAALAVGFGRVATDDGEFTSALSAPSLPAEVAAPVLGIHGLQPQMRMRHHLVRPAAGGTASIGYIPSQIAQAYGAASLGLTGQGQTIAIVSGAFVSASDLQGFWTAAGIAGDASRIQNITVGSGPDTSSIDDAGTEAALDVEWANALAPAATIRVYGANDQDVNFFDEILLQIAADLPANPSLHQVSISYGEDEAGVDHDYLTILSQYCATLSSAGVSIFVASGDNGATDGGNGLTVCVPTSDPSVTGVGGTSLALDATGNVTSETAWSDSGGGASVYFNRPSWQSGTGVASGSTRLVPDVAASADPKHPAMIYYQGSSQGVGGTSWATPVWAAFCALINQSRAASGLSAVGNLSTRIYGQLGSAALRDIVSGSNGGFSAGAGYDEVTGVGAPNVAGLVAASLTPPTVPMVYSQLGDRFTVAGQPATFYVVASGAATLSYQWQRQASGSSSWSNLSSGGIYRGANSAMLVVTPSLAMNGDHFQCTVTNSQGSATSPGAKLTVSSIGVSTLAGWPGAAGTADGQGWNARFGAGSPGGIRGDGAGTEYITDGNGNTVRMMTADGTVTTIVGQPGQAGSTNGAANVALLDSPSGVVRDAAGNLYIADDGDATIRKRTPDGQVSLLAGDAYVTGTQDGKGAAARFTDPEDLAIDSSGNLYVADGAANTIRMVAPDGTVTTYAGSGATAETDGTGTAAAFNDPVAVTVDGSGTVYVADGGGNTIRKIATGGVVTTVAGGRKGSSDGVGSSARFNFPTGLTLDNAGNLYVADSGNNEIRQVVLATNTVTTVAGSPDIEENIDGIPTAARFSGAGQLWWDASAGCIFVADTGNSTIRRLVGGVVTAPAVLAQPAGAPAVNAGQSVTLTVTASGTAPLAYQWQALSVVSSTWNNLSDGSGYAGTATNSLTISGATVAQSGTQYRVQVSNPAGSAISNSASLQVNGTPVVLSSVQAAAVSPGGSVTLNVTAAGVGLSYQWLFNNQAIAGATAASYTISNYSAAAAGAYSVVVANSYGSVTSVVANVSSQTARLINLSAKALSSPGSGILDAGFVIGGSAGVTKQLLLRGDGPSLAGFGVSGALPDPVLTLFNSSNVVVDQNTKWGGSGTLSAAFTSVGAFSLAANSADSAMVKNLSAANYTAEVEGASQDAGIALAELYDMDSLSATTRLVNLSARSPIAGSSSILTVGFVIGGTGTETVLIRAIGPTLSEFGITNPLANPQLTLFNASSVAMQSNAGWGGGTLLSSTFTAVGAFALPNQSADAAILVSLPAGNYTAQVSGLNGASGVALLEVYEVQ